MKQAGWIRPSGKTQPSATKFAGLITTLRELLPSCFEESNVDTTQLQSHILSLFRDDIRSTSLSTQDSPNSQPSRLPSGPCQTMMSTAPPQGPGVRAKTIFPDEASIFDPGMKPVETSLLPPNFWGS